MIRSFVFAGILALATPALSGEPKVVGALATASGGGTWRFDVTVSHADTGWDHFADAWEVRGPAGERLGYRELLHPHVTEQPFTRSLSGVSVPAGVREVTIRAHDTVHGWSRSGYRVSLPGS